MNSTKTAVTLALTAALGSSGVALAGDNPFGMQTLGQGYQVAEADTKMPEGKCGAMKGEAAGADMDKAKEKRQMRRQGRVQSPGQSQGWQVRRRQVWRQQGQAG